MISLIFDFDTFVFIASRILTIRPHAREQKFLPHPSVLYQHQSAGAPVQTPARFPINQFNQQPNVDVHHSNDSPSLGTRPKLPQHHQFQQPMQVDMTNNGAGPTQNRAHMAAGPNYVGANYAAWQNETGANQAASARFVASENVSVPGPHYDCDGDDGQESLTGSASDLNRSLRNRATVRSVNDFRPPKIARLLLAKYGKHDLSSRWGFVYGRINKFLFLNSLRPQIERKGVNS